MSTSNCLVTGAQCATIAAEAGTAVKNCAGTALTTATVPNIANVCEIGGVMYPGAPLPVGHAGTSSFGSSGHDVWHNPLGCPVEVKIGAKLLLAGTLAANTQGTFKAKVKGVLPYGMPEIWVPLQAGAPPTDFREETAWAYYKKVVAPGAFLVLSPSLEITIPSLAAGSAIDTSWISTIIEGIAAATPVTN